MAPTGRRRPEFGHLPLQGRRAEILPHQVSVAGARTEASASRSVDASSGPGRAASARCTTGVPRAAAGWVRIALRDRRDRSRSGERGRELRQDRQIDVRPDARETPHAQRERAPLILSRPNSRSTAPLTIEAFPPLRPPGDKGAETASLHPYRLRAAELPRPRKAGPTGGHGTRPGGSTAGMNRCYDRLLDHAEPLPGFVNPFAKHLLGGFAIDRRSPASVVTPSRPPLARQ